MQRQTDPWPAITGQSVSPIIELQATVRFCLKNSVLGGPAVLGVLCIFQEALAPVRSPPGHQSPKHQFLSLLILSDVSGRSEAWEGVQRGEQSLPGV